jgi:hypothetical protein
VTVRKGIVQVDLDPIAPFESGDHVEIVSADAETMIIRALSGAAATYEIPAYAVLSCRPTVIELEEELTDEELLDRLDRSIAWSDAAARRAAK